MMKTMSGVLNLVVVVLIFTFLLSDQGLVQCSVRQSKSCSEKDVTINQASVGKSPSGIPTFSVEIANQCSSSACAIANVHLRCGEFSSDTPIKPEIFRRLSNGDCLVNNGAALVPGRVISFKYSTTRMYQLSVSDLRVSCST